MVKGGKKEPRHNIYYRKTQGHLDDYIASDIQETHRRQLRSSERACDSSITVLVFRKITEKMAQS